MASLLYQHTLIIIASIHHFHYGCKIAPTCQVYSLGSVVGRDNGVGLQTVPPTPADAPGSHFTHQQAGQGGQGGVGEQGQIDPACEWVERQMCIVVQLCPTLCDPMDCSPPGSSVHGDSLGKNTGVGCHALLQGIFPTQGSNPGLPHCRLILTIWATRDAHEYWVGSLSLLQRTFPTQDSNWGLLHCRQILYQLSYQGRPEKSLYGEWMTNIS